MEPSVTTRSRRSAAMLLDAIVVVLLLAILGLPVAAMVAIRHAGTAAAAPESLLPPLVTTAAPPARDLPVFTAGGRVERDIGDGRVLASAPELFAAMEAAAGRLFGGADPTAFWDVLATSDLDVDYYPPNEFVSGRQVVPYPYRYPYLDAVLDGLLPARMSSARAQVANELDELLL